LLFNSPLPPPPTPLPLHHTAGNMKKLKTEKIFTVFCERGFFIRLLISKDSKTVKTVFWQQF
jgi:hypothetical protein